MSQFVVRPLGRTILLPLACCLLSCTSCATKPATFQATITATDGKPLATITGTATNNASWSERYLGPIGSLFTGVAALLLPVPVP